jgi:hypothetical protein
VTQGLSNCGTRTTTGTLATVQWYTGLARKIKGSYFPYSSSTKKQWKYCWQHCVTVRKIIVGGALNVLNHIVVGQLKSLTDANPAVVFLSTYFIPGVPIVMSHLSCQALVVCHIVHRCFFSNSGFITQ